MAHDHNAAANDAIAETIEDLRRSVTESWMTLKPTESPLNFPSRQEALGFLGEIIRRYREMIEPCTCPGAASFDAYKSKTLIQFRDAIVEATVCV